MDCRVGLSSPRNDGGTKKADELMSIGFLNFVFQIY